MNAEIIKRIRPANEEQVRMLREREKQTHQLAIQCIISYMNELGKDETYLNVPFDQFSCGWASKLKRDGPNWVLVEHGNGVVDRSGNHKEFPLNRVPTGKLIEIYENIIL